MDLILAFRINPTFFYISVIILGLIIGSFLNVVIHRLPIILLRDWRRDCREFLTEKFPGDMAQGSATPETNNKYNLVVPRSACPQCGHQISALENIPVLSYLFLKGRCKACKTPISARYPVIETISALLTFVSAWKFGVSYAFLFAACLSWALLCLTMIDYDHMYLPDQITLPFLWLGLMLNLQGMYTDLHSAVIGAIAGYLSLWSVYHVFKLATGKEGMGFGDFKLLALFGAWFGWQMLPAIILLSSLIGAVVGILLIVLKLHQKGKPIPFGPYLAGAGWVAMMWGKDLNALYFHYFLGSS
ncbi:MAG: prepilin peptidase [Gammaproteobacteria bacterium]|nr:prepilin peptidase [Gammaproteobacteria bacterium]